MKVDIYNQKGEVIGGTNLPKDIFDVDFNSDLVHQVAVSLAANSRQISAHTKNRGEVRGGGKKPWRQKGTGRARHGSIRSPLWKGGGVTHGPRTERIFEREIPKKMRRKALFMVLSQKAKDKQLIILDRIELGVDGKPAKTKEMAAILSKLPCNSQTTLVALPNYDKKIVLATRNINKTSVEDTRNINVLQLLNHKFLLSTKEGIKTIENIFLK
jgi:large subunit ribosomal protein L4